MFIYSIRYRDGCGRWSVAFAQAASQSDAEAIATCRYGAFHSVSRASLVLSNAAREHCLGLEPNRSSPTFRTGRSCSGVKVHPGPLLWVSH
jgi:hypothetical protein